jgi:anaerobic dimethyl sulfoxide reductase subunit B (iron-sulfur subunit)
MAQMGFSIDLTSCGGCKCCQVACKDKNNLNVGEFFRRVVEVEGGTYPSPWVYNISMACGHCTNAACMAACPQSAITKDANGIVTINSSLCVGCRRCEWACPYGAPTFIEATGKMAKCNACVDERDALGNPYCVGACPMRVLKFDAITTLQAQAGAVSTIKNYADPAMTNPNVVFIPKAVALP